MQQRAVSVRFPDCVHILMGGSGFLLRNGDLRGAVGTVRLLGVNEWVYEEARDLVSGF